MKLTVEIKNGRFEYSYEIGEHCRHNSSSHLSAEMLCAFTSLLNHCASVTRFDRDEFMDEMKGKCWIEKNPQAAIEYAKQRVARTDSDRKKE